MAATACHKASASLPNGTDIHSARTAIDGFLATPASDRRDFAIHVLASEGIPQITLTATDPFGLAATVRFGVQVEFHWPSGAIRDWRATLGNAAEGAGTQTP